METPVLVPCPGIDPHIDAISVDGKMYLATSPELQMKRLLGMGMKRIFQFTKAFRRGEKGKLHNPEFNILEWYQTEKDYFFLMDEVESLISRGEIQACTWHQYTYVDNDAEAA